MNPLGIYCSKALPPALAIWHQPGRLQRGITLANFDAQFKHAQSIQIIKHLRTDPLLSPILSPAPRLPYQSLTILRGDFEEIVASSFHEMNFAALVVPGHIFPFLVHKTATEYVRPVTGYACKNNICHLCWLGDRLCNGEVPYVLRMR